MAECVDLMEEAFLKIADDGEQILNKDHIMNIFKPIRDRVTPLDDYLTTSETSSRMFNIRESVYGSLHSTNVAQHIYL